MDGREQLKEILGSMDVPQAKLNLSDGDMRWLGRNIGVRNQEHPRFREAVRLLYDLLPDALHVWHQPATQAGE
jgi:hypothetical protein